MKLSQRILTAAIVATGLSASGFQAYGYVSLGNVGSGSGSLIGGDLTDPENDADPQAYIGYNATFNASEENGFVANQESAWNVFDNQVGGGDAKWCCGDQNNFPTNPISIDATLTAGAFYLTRFTLTSGNDTAGRDPALFKIQGSNDGTNFTTIYDYTANVTPWGTNDPTDRNEVLRFDDGGVDFPTQTVGYNTFRFITTATGLSGGAAFQLGEIEYFGTPVPEPTTLALGVISGLGMLGLVRRRRN